MIKNVKIIMLFNETVSASGGLSFSQTPDKFLSALPQPLWAGNATERHMQEIRTSFYRVALNDNNRMPTGSKYRHNDVQTGQ